MFRPTFCKNWGLVRGVRRDQDREVDGQEDLVSGLGAALSEGRRQALDSATTGLEVVMVTDSGQGMEEHVRVGSGQERDERVVSTGIAMAVVMAAAAADLSDVREEAAFAAIDRQDRHSAGGIER